MLTAHITRYVDELHKWCITSFFGEMIGGYINTFNYKYTTYLRYLNKKMDLFKAIALVVVYSIAAIFK